MKKQPKYSPEVIEAVSEYESQWAAITSIAAKIGCTPEKLRRCVRQQEGDTGRVLVRLMPNRSTSKP